MELDDFKAAWAQYDEKLTENLKFNEELLKSMNLDKSNREFNKLLTYEIVAVVVVGLLLVYIGTATIKFMSEIKFLMSGIVSIISLLPLLLFAIIKTNMLSKIDYYNASVVDLQKSISLFNQKYLVFRKLELFIFPLYVISTVPVLGIAARNFDFFVHIERYGAGVFLALVIGYPLLIWIYKNWYDKKIQHTKRFLEEINKFEKE